MNKTVIKTLSYIGAAINEGQPHLGVRRGPDYIRYSGVFDSLKAIYKVPEIVDYGNVSWESVPPEDRLRDSTKHVVNNLHILDPLLQTLNSKVRSIHQKKLQNNLILSVGGDHSIALATTNASLSAHPNLKVLWIGANPDFTNPYIKGIPNLNYHGMTASHLTGVFDLPGFTWLKQKLPMKNLVMIGIRDIEDDQYDSIKKNKIKTFTMDHVVQYGIGEVMTQAIKYLDPEGNSPFHISFDLSAIDPYQASQTGTVYRDGLSHKQSCHIVRRIVNQRNLVSMDLVELNPDIGTNVKRPKYRDQQYLKDDLSESIGTAVDLITSLCSKTLTL